MVYGIWYGGLHELQGLRLRSSFVHFHVTELRIDFLPTKIYIYIYVLLHIVDSNLFDRSRCHPASS